MAFPQRKFLKISYNDTVNFITDYERNSIELISGKKGRIAWVNLKDDNGELYNYCISEKIPWHMSAMQQFNQIEKGTHIAITVFSDGIDVQTLDGGFSEVDAMPTEPDIGDNVPPQQAPIKNTSSNYDKKDRSFALSYSKDLVVSDKLDITNMYNEAVKMHKFLSTDYYHIIDELTNTLIGADAEDIERAIKDIADVTGKFVELDEYTLNEFNLALYKYTEAELNDYMYKIKGIE